MNAPADPSETADPSPQASGTAPHADRVQIPAEAETPSAASPLSAQSDMSASASDTGLGMSTPTGKVRAQFEAAELAIVLSHYDIGIIESIQEFPRGSRRAPKLRLKTDTGRYLLKRRAKGKADAYRVAFCHGIQIHLAERQFPLPHLIGTKRDNNSMLRWDGAIYELFEYIKGSGYDNSLEATSDSGKTLALFHKLLKDYRSDYEPPSGSYHASRPVYASLQKIPETLLRIESPPMKNDPEGVRSVVAYLYDAYQRAAERVRDIGIDRWGTQIVHSDWHPGNMLFRGSRVVAVIDYDTARIQQRVLDIGNGALQFSILGGGDDPATWPDYVDETRFKRFLRGYEAVPDCVLSKAEIRCIPWLMIEALIAEMTVPIAATGHFGRIEGVGMLRMVERKVRWIEKRIDTLIETVAG